MGIQVLDTVMEGQTSYITVSFTDEHGGPVSPTAISYRVDDLLTQESLLASGAITPPASSVVIELPPEVNRVVDHDKGLEVHVCTIEAAYGGGKKITGEIRYGVVNLPFHDAGEPPA
jgi:hypothetical protein